MDILEINLRDADGNARLRLLLADADLLLTSSRPSSLQKLKLSWNELHPLFPRLCHVAIVGESAGRAGVAGHDLTYQARAGLLREPRVPAILAADVLGAQCAVSAALELLYVRERTGAGSYKEVAIADAAREFSASIAHGLTSSEGVLGGASPFYNVYRAADGYIALAAIEPHFRERVLKCLELESEDRAAFERTFAKHSCRYWENAALDCDFPLAELLTNSNGEP
jgi:crotonobetainyl-CoA:carnitine CoA-transferase CaiB-like acyl-CoA transferase